MAKRKSSVVPFRERLKRLEETARNEIDDAIRDPDLLDVRRPLAIGETILTHTPLLPSEESLKRLARFRVANLLGGEIRAALAEAKNAEELLEAWNALTEPTDADIEAVMLEQHERSMRIVMLYSKRQTEAVKMVEWGRLIRDQVVPLFNETGLRVAGVLKKHGIPPEKRAAIVADIRQAVAAVIGELAARRDLTKPP